MDKKWYLFVLSCLLFLTACGSSSESKTKSASTSENEKFIVSGYKLGEIPAIPSPEIKGLGLVENPDAKITLDMTKKLSSVEGITVTPVRIKNGQVTSGDATVQTGENGDGQYSDSEKTVQSDGDGSGQYSDKNITIQRDSDGSGQYVDKKNKITLQVDSDGAGQFSNDKDGITLQVDSNGEGMYTNKEKNYSIIVSDDQSSYTHGDIDITIMNDGSGTYSDSSKDLEIKNDGKGNATINVGDQTKKVKAKALDKPSKLPLLRMIPAVPVVEANTIKITLDAGVLFNVDKYNIRKDAQNVLNDLADILNKADIKNFEIEGHTDSDASEAHNQTLSENRANSVKKYLQKQGVKAEISTKGYGESKPIATNKTAAGKQKNRRVEVLIPTV
ncbi:OmpA family protein [Kandleria vitulina]|uniref:OmpA family protein n=1 Tax=Kandleria vitulina TaxID=1630 RepID=UPI0033255339